MNVECKDKIGNFQGFNIDCEDCQNVVKDFSSLEVGEDIIFSLYNFVHLPAQGYVPQRTLAQRTLYTLKLINKDK